MKTTNEDPTNYVDLENAIKMEVVVDYLLLL